MPGKDIFRSGKQLFTGVAVGVAERDISHPVLATACNLLVFNIADHPPQGYAQFVDGIIIELLDVETVVGDGNLRE